MARPGRAPEALLAAGGRPISSALTIAAAAADPRPGQERPRLRLIGGTAAPIPIRAPEREHDHAYCSKCGRALYARRAAIGVCSSCMPRLARACRDCGRDMHAFRRDYLCQECRANFRAGKPVQKPGCFTQAEWDGEPGRMPSLRAEYPRFSPCRDCTADFRFNMARESRCDLYRVSDDGNLMQLISAESLAELMEAEIEDPDD